MGWCQGLAHTPFLQHPRTPCTPPSGKELYTSQWQIALLLCGMAGGVSCTSPPPPQSQLCTILSGWWQFVGNHPSRGMACGTSVPCCKVWRKPGEPWVRTAGKSRYSNNSLVNTSKTVLLLRAIYRQQWVNAVEIGLTPQRGQCLRWHIFHHPIT